MKRSVHTVIKEAFALLWNDIKNMKTAILFIFLYLFVNRRFFYSGCLWVTVTGFPCPSCGLTRAGLALLRGEFQKAWEIHPFIYAIAALGLLFGIYRYILQKNQKVFVKCLIALILGMLIFYFYRMYYIFPDKPPMSYYRHNVIRILSDELKRL